MKKTLKNKENPWFFSVNCGIIDTQDFDGAKKNENFG